jgi:hypothetical protein
MTMQCLRRQLRPSAWLVCLSLALPLTGLAQTHEPPDPNAAAAKTAPTGQAPVEVMKKLSDLVHAGKYAEAQQLTAGLLLAYPDDQRLVKAKALLDKSPAAAGTANAAPSSNQQANDAVSTPPVASMSARQFTGMDKVEYNALIELARQAQQNADLKQQKASLKQFMVESSAFLQKYSDQMLLWQLRAASALSLDNADAGYEAAQKLLAAGAGDSNDPNLQQLFSQLKIKGWLDKQKVEEYQKYGGILGTWSLSGSSGDQSNQQFSGYTEVFSKSDRGDIEGRFVGGGHKRLEPDLRGTILSSGEIKWEHYLPNSSTDPEWERRGALVFTVDEIPGKQRYPSGWQLPISYILSDDKRTMTMVFPLQGRANRKESIKYGLEHPVTLVFEKVSDSQSY